MAITANMTTHEGIVLTDAYCYIPTAYVKKFNGEWSLKTPQEMNKDGSVKTEAVYEQSDATWKLIYDVLIYADADKRADMHEQNFRIQNRHVDHFKLDYDLNETDNPFKVAYEHLKTNDQLTNVQDA
tara:strand:- start:228 stop:608 length:381 start_codon:yes stop_codon:yes gene_type:complete